MNLPQRKIIRLKDYDYSQAGYYFVTICTHNRQNLLCDIIDHANVKFTDIGLQVKNSILNIPSIFTSVYIELYVIMPNHLHIIVVINETDGRGTETGGQTRPYRISLAGLNRLQHTNTIK